MSNDIYSILDGPDTIGADAAAIPGLRIKMCGVYVGSLNQPTCDASKIVPVAKAAGFNGFSLHGAERWSNGTYLPNPQPFYGFNWNPLSHQFDLQSGKLNQVYRDHRTGWLTECAKAGMYIEECFWDGFFTSNWDSGVQQWGQIWHPLRHNNIGINWAASAKPLYESWNRQDPSNPNNFAWLSWQGDYPHITFNPVKPIGHALDGYFKALAADTAAVAAQYPALNHLYRFRTFNEQYAHMILSPTGKWIVDYSRCLGGYNQIEFYLSGLFKAAGVTAQIVDDWSALTPTGIELGTMTKAANSLHRIGINYEIHGIADDHSAQAIVAAGMPKDVNYSKDGAKQITAGQYYGSCKAIDHVAGVNCEDFCVPDFSQDGDYKYKDILNSCLTIIPKMGTAIF